MPRYPRKRNYPRKASSTKKIARQEAYKVYNGLQENQYHSVSLATTASSTVTFTALLNIAQGDTNLTRDGNEIIVKRIRLNFSLAAADTTNIIRIVIFWWDNDRVPTLADLYIDGTGDVDSVLVNQNKNARVLKDKSFTMSTTGSNNVVKYKYDKAYKKGIRVEYNSSTSTDVHRNQLYLMRVSDSGAASHPVFNLKGVIYFND